MLTIISHFDPRRQVTKFKERKTFCFGEHANDDQPPGAIHLKRASERQRAATASTHTGLYCTEIHGMVWPWSLSECSVVGSLPFMLYK